MTVQSPESSALALGFPDLEQVESLQSIAHLFGSSKPRRGIYLLHFNSGLFYVGQAVDVVRRFSQHRRNHTDIIAFSFIPAQTENLDIIEKNLIYKAELLGLKITNAVHVTSVVGDTDLDLVVSRSDQENWLSSLSYFDGEQLNDSKIVLPEAQQVRFSKHFAKIENHVLFPSVLPLLQRYESPRILRRLKSLRGLSHEEIKQVFTRGSGTRSAHGAGAPRRVPFAVGGH